MPNYRHEYKFQLSAGDYLCVRSRLRAALRHDPHAGPAGEYEIHSIYFDNEEQKALREKLNGVRRREKFRLRWYGGDLGLIRLEKKVKEGGLGYKLACPISLEEARRLLAGDQAWMPAGGRPLLAELAAKMTCEGLRPRVLVEYVREPFVFPAGNVRVALDRALRRADFTPGMLDRPIHAIPAGSGVLMEVKYDGFLPDTVRALVQLDGRQAGAFSKFAAACGYV